MATKFGIAFPVVITEEQRAYPIRIQLSPAPNNVHGLNVMFKGRKKTAQEKAGELIQYPLTPDYPFTEEKGRVSEIVRIFSSFSQRLQEEDKAMTLTFISDEPGHPEVKQENNGLYKMAFSPKSAGVALNLMQAIKSCDELTSPSLPATSLNSSTSLRSSQSFWCRKSVV